MALEQQMSAQPNEERLSSEEDRELDIMVMLAQNLIDDAGYEVIEQAQASKDPGTVIGQFLMQLGSQLGEQLPFDISPRIMFAVGGWVEQISDYIQETYKVPKKIMDRAEIFIASSAQQMAQQGQAQQAGGAPQEAAPQGAPAPAVPVQGGV